MFRSPTIYSRDAKGLTRSWRYEVDGARWRSVSGLVNGAKVESGWTDCVGKQKRSDEEQAVFESSSEYHKKLDREYRLSIAELDAVPPSPMLAQDYAKQKRVTFPVFSQPKLDGIRALVSKSGAFSREFQRHLNVDHILEALTPAFERFPDLILDGELYNHDLRDDFNKISSVVRKKIVGDHERAESKALVQFHVYDCIDPAWKDQNFSDRNAIIRGLLSDFHTGSVIVEVATNYVRSQDDLDAFYAGYVTMGYEGQMVRLDEPYEISKRSKFLLKRKEFQTAEFKLIDIEPGVGNWAGLAKRIIFQLPDGRTAGAGLKGNQTFAKYLLDEKDRFIGGDVTIRYFSLTPDGVPRFPVAVDFHPEGRVD